MNMHFALGTLLVLAGCTGLYLASPHQRWFAHPWPPRRTRAAAMLLLTAGLIALWQVMQPVAAVFTFIAWAMLLFVLFPYAGALLSLKRIR